MTPTSLRGWAAIVALVAMVPLVAYAASATDRHAPAAEEPAWRPAPSISLRLEPEVLRLEPGEYARAPYHVRNDGERPEDVLVETTTWGDGVVLMAAGAQRFHLAPGEEARGVLRLRAAEEWRPLGLVQVQASAGEEPRVVTFAMLRVESPPPVLEVAPLPAPRPFLPPPEPLCPAMRCHLPCEARLRAHAYDHDHAHAHAPGLDGSFLLHLILRGRVADGQLVIDLDDDLRARLPALMPLMPPPVMSESIVIVEPHHRGPHHVETYHAEPHHAEPPYVEPQPEPWHEEPAHRPTWEEGRS